MTPAQCKQIASALDFEFYWNQNLRAYACYPKDLSQEASYHSKFQLAGMTQDQFSRCYLARQVEVGDTVEILAGPDKGFRALVVAECVVGFVVHLNEEDFLYARAELLVTSKAQG